MPHQINTNTAKSSPSQRLPSTGPMTGDHVCSGMTGQTHTMVGQHKSGHNHTHASHMLGSHKTGHTRKDGSIPR